MITRAKQIFWNWVDWCVEKKHAALLYYREPKRVNDLTLIRRVKGETKMLLWEPEAYQIIAAVRSVAQIPGDIAEVGAYRGGSAKLIAETEKQKEIHIFDTFTGLPTVDVAKDADRFSTGQYATPLEEVKRYLSAYSNIHIYPGMFPGTSTPIIEKQFSFVHLDVDIYQSTLDSLAFFYPKMQKGGIILSHDYSTARGVRQAFDEYFSDKSETVVELMSSQCIVVKA